MQSQAKKKIIQKKIVQGCSFNMSSCKDNLLKIGLPDNAELDSGQVNNSQISKRSVKHTQGNILLVSNSNQLRHKLEDTIEHIGYVTLLAESGVQALELVESQSVSYILVDDTLSDMSVEKLIHSIRAHTVYQDTPVIILASSYDEKRLSSYSDAGCDDFMFSPFNSFYLKARITSLKQIRNLKYLYKNSINEQLVAKRILNSALEERSIEFEEIGILKQAKSIFSGDLFLTARHPNGSLNILLADFTGHGLSAAIGALPVADVFSVMTKKGFDLDYILENINRKLYTLLPTSMFMACSALNISNDLKHVKVWNGGMPDIYIRAYRTGDVNHKIESSNIPLGIDEEILNRFKLETVNISHGDQLILYSDGLTDAMDAEDNMFGYQSLEHCLLLNKDEMSIFPKLVKSFSEFCGDIVPMDDVTLACVPCTTSLMQTRVSNDEL